MLIDRTIGDVFSFLTDMTNSPSWGRTASTERVAAEVLGVGSRFVEMELPEDGGHRKETEITEFKAPTFFAYHSVSENGVEERAEVSLEEVGRQTRVQPTAEVYIPGMSQDREHAFIEEMRLGVRPILDKLKAVLEGDESGNSKSARL